MKDILIVGGGIAGSTLAWQWHLQGKSIHWVADDAVSSSHVAAGVFNPVVLKRFSPVWKAEEQLELLFSFYSEIQKYIDSPLIHLMPVWRRFHDDKERTTWIRKSTREDLDNLMQTDPVDTSVDGIDATNGYGVVNHTGWLDAQLYMERSMEYFSTRKEFSKEFLAIGNVPFKEKDRIYKAYKTALDNLYDGLKLDKVEKEKVLFEAKIETLKSSLNPSKTIQVEKEKIRKQITELTKEITNYENNLGFFSPSKGSESLFKGVKDKIDGGKANIEKLKRQLKQFSKLEIDDNE